MRKGRDLSPMEVWVVSLLYVVLVLGLSGLVGVEVSSESSSGGKSESESESESLGKSGSEGGSVIEEEGTISIFEVSSINTTVIVTRLNWFRKKGHSLELILKYMSGWRQSPFLPAWTPASSTAPSTLHS